MYYDIDEAFEALKNYFLLVSGMSEDDDFIVEINSCKRTKYNFMDILYRYCKDAYLGDISDIDDFVGDKLRIIYEQFLAKKSSEYHIRELIDKNDWCFKMIMQPGSFKEI